jgi:hypothetical protein
LEDADVLDVEDDLEDLELEEVLEDDEAVLDRDDEGVVDDLELELEVPEKRFEDRIAEGKDISIRRSSTTGNISD